VNLDALCVVWAHRVNELGFFLSSKEYLKIFFMYSFTIESSLVKQAVKCNYRLPACKNNHLGAVNTSPGTSAM